MDFRKFLSAGSAVVVASFLAQPLPSPAQPGQVPATNSGATNGTAATSVTPSGGFVNGFAGGFNPFFPTTGVGSTVVVPSGFGYVENFMPADPSVDMHYDSTDYSLHNTTWPPSFGRFGTRRDVHPLVQDWNTGREMRRVIPHHRTKHTRRHR
jgi:hypothetical protein